MPMKVPKACLVGKIGEKLSHWEVYSESGHVYQYAKLVKSLGTKQDLRASLTVDELQVTSDVLEGEMERETGADVSRLARPELAKTNGRAVPCLLIG